MLEFITEKGTKLYYDVTYEIGGYNHFTGGTIPRAYILWCNAKEIHLQPLVG